MPVFASSPIPTGGAEATRAADVLPLPFPARPQAMTIYVRFVELGTALIADARVLEIGASPSARPRFVIGERLGFYRIFYQTDVSSVTSLLAVSPGLGDTVELLATLTANGEVQLSQSVNGAAATSAAQSSAVALPPAWSDSFLHVHSVGASSQGFIGLRNLVFHRGVQSLATMRRLAGV